MRFLGSIILISLLSAFVTWFMPWWMIAVVSFAVGFVIHLSSARAFFSGFLGIALFWLIAILFIDNANDHILSMRMAKLFSLHNYWLFILVDIIVGGLVGGLASWSGAVLRHGFMKPQQ